MGGTSSTVMSPQQDDEGNHRIAGNDNVGKLRRKLQQGGELPEAADDMVQKEHHELLKKFDQLEAISMAQQKELDFYRRIISVSSTTEMDRRLNEVLDQMRKFSDDLVLLTRETSRVLHESSKCAQHRDSIQSNLDRLTSTLLIVTEENKKLKEGCWPMSDKTTASEESQLDAEAEEKALSTTSRIQRKKARTNLRSPEVGKHTPQFSSSHEQLVESQEGPNDGLLAQITPLRADFVTLHSKLQSAERHIVNISGNLGALLPRETVKNEFKSLVGATLIWITTRVQPAINTAEQCWQAYERAEDAWLQDGSLEISRERNEDFRTLSSLKGADQNILHVIIFDLLVTHIFSGNALYGNHDLQRQVDVINRLAQSMRLNSDSSKCLYNARRWRSEAHTALLAGEEIRALRDDFSYSLVRVIAHTVGLAALLDPNNKVALDAATTSLRQEVVLPAIELQDKMLCAIDKFSLEVPHYWYKACALQAEFFRDLGNLDCKNFGDGPPRLTLENLQRHLSDDEIKVRLRAICPAIPALTLREVDDKTWGPRTILVKQQVWVDLHPKEASISRREKHGFFWLLYNLRSQCMQNMSQPEADGGRDSWFGRRRRAES